MESLEHHKKAATAAIDCVSIFGRLPPSYFTEAWHALSKILLASVTFTLIQESLLSPDDRLKVQARDSLLELDAIATRYGASWVYGRYVQNIMRTASKIDHDTYSALGRRESSTDLSPKDQLDPTFASSLTGDAEWDQFALAEWDDLSQMFGLGAINSTTEWFGSF